MNYLVTLSIAKSAELRGHWAWASILYKRLGQHASADLCEAMLEYEARTDRAIPLRDHA